jgi:hypothetical protein
LVVAAGLPLTGLAVLPLSLYGDQLRGEFGQPRILYVEFFVRRDDTGGVLEFGEAFLLALKIRSKRR